MLWRDGIGANNANRVPRSKLFWQLMATRIVREGPQFGVLIRFENKDSHRLVLADARGRLGLTVGLNTRLLARSRDRAVENCLFACSLAKSAYRLAFLASRLFRGLFVKASPFHLTEDALTLHFLF